MLSSALHLLNGLCHSTERDGQIDVGHASGQDIFEQIVASWEQAAFSSVPDFTLNRYFHQQLEGISKFSDTLFQDHRNDSEWGCQPHLLRLIDHLHSTYRTHLNDHNQAPLAYQQRTFRRLENFVNTIREGLRSARITPSLRRCLLNFLHELRLVKEDVHFTFRSLLYIERLLGEMVAIDYSNKDMEAGLVMMLSAYSFNHLAFLGCRQEMILSDASKIKDASSRLIFFQQQKATIAACPVRIDQVYDPGFPPLKVMLTDWLVEQIELTGVIVRQEITKPEPTPLTQVQKQALNLSVAHLACLVRLFMEENILSSDNIQSVLHFFAASYRTKRQTSISAGSLSKEFYSIDQQTAARVKDMLQKMILRINRNFFPVVVAISTASLFHPGTC